MLILRLSRRGARRRDTQDTRDSHVHGAHERRCPGRAASLSQETRTSTARLPHNLHTPTSAACASEAPACRSCASGGPVSTSPDSPSRRCEGAVCRALAAACSMKSRQPGLFEACSNRPETGRRQARPRPAGTHRCTHTHAHSRTPSRTHTLTHARARRFGQEQGWWLGQATRSLAAQAAEPGYLDRRVATADTRGPRSRRSGLRRGAWAGGG